MIDRVAIHNKNGKGLLLICEADSIATKTVAIHNKNGKGLLLVILLIIIIQIQCRNPQ